MAFLLQQPKQTKTEGFPEKVLELSRKELGDF